MQIYSVHHNFPGIHRYNLPPHPSPWQQTYHATPPRTSRSSRMPQSDTYRRKRHLLRRRFSQRGWPRSFVTLATGRKIKFLSPSYLVLGLTQLAVGRLPIAEVIGLTKGVSIRPINGNNVTRIAHLLVQSGYDMSNPLTVAILPASGEAGSKQVCEASVSLLDFKSKCV